VSAATIHRAAPGDVPELVELMQAFYAESSFPLDREWGARSFNALLSNPLLGCAWLARVGRDAVGHIVLSVRYTMEHGALGGYIDDLYVKPERRRQRIASQLLEALVRESNLRACASLHVEVAESNVAALAAYQRFGLATVKDGRVLLSRALDVAGA
jgi:ribosomal protein S18 acetylase RimI-like enzyme